MKWVPLVAAGALLVHAGPAAAARCAASDHTTLPNAYLAAKTTLVPPGASSLRLCRYGGLNAGAKAGKLIASTSVTTRATIVQLTGAFDALPRQSAVVFHCPMDDGSAIVAIFGYAKSASDPVRVGLTGCLIVSNEDLVRTAASASGQRLIRQLEQLLRPVTTSPVGGSVPVGFDPEAFTAISDDDYWVLGTVACSTGRCPAIVRTTDGGKSFARIGAPALASSTATPALLFADHLDGFAFELQPSDVLYATHDGGATWKRLDLHVVAFTVADGDAYAVTARCSANRGCSDYELERSRASSNAWSASPLPFAVDTAVPDLTANGSRVWILGTRVGGQPQHDELARSTDGGRTFVTRPGPCDADLGGNLAPTASAVVWAVCPTGMMAGAWRSMNGGVTFAPVKAPELVNSARLAQASGETAVVAGSGAGVRLLRTTDGGATWKPARIPAGATYIVWLGFTDAEVGAAIVQMRYDAATGVETDELWRTTDGGEIWSTVRFR